jgi:hypothetical protein
VTRLALSLRPSLEMGALQAVAEVQDPVVEVDGEGEGEGDPQLRIREGAVDVALRFPNLDALHRFVHRVAALRRPTR